MINSRVGGGPPVLSSGFAVVAQRLVPRVVNSVGAISEGNGKVWVSELLAGVGLPRLGLEWQQWGARKYVIKFI